MEDPATYTAFAGTRRVVSGALVEMLRATKQHMDRSRSSPAAGETLLIFNDRTGEQIDFDFRGSIEEVLVRAMPKPGPGRPKLGVVSREVSLLPRHWEWLEAQPSGASAALRRLVEHARKRESGEAEARRTIEAAGRVMTVMAGNRPGFEEALRALYARDLNRFERQISRWPRDVRGYLLERMRAALPADATSPPPVVLS